jgi:hypothetical protein
VSRLAADLARALDLVPLAAFSLAFSHSQRPPIAPAISQRYGDTFLGLGDVVGVAGPPTRKWPQGSLVRKQPTVQPQARRVRGGPSSGAGAGPLKVSSHQEPGNWNAHEKPSVTS